MQESMTSVIETGPTNPLVSVVVTTYQHAAFIEECIQGILMQQTTFPVEVLIGEDESTDGTREICQRLAEDHPERIKLFLRNRKDVLYIQGHATGRANLLHLLGQAKGKYIALCEGDDYWTDPSKLQQQVELMEAHPHASGCFNFVQVLYTADGTWGKIYGAHSDKLIFGADDMITTMAPCHTSGFLYRRSALPSLPRWVDKFLVSMDMALFTLVADAGEVICLPKVMGVYRKNQGGITETAGFRNDQYHRNRIDLWLYVDQHLQFRNHSKCMEVILFHWRAICTLCPPRRRLNHLNFLFGRHPTWFLRNQRFAVARLREALKR